MKKCFAVLLCALLLALCASALADDWIVQAELVAERDYPVYSAPDEMSPRGADNDAVLPAGSGFRVYHQSEDWLLIQYDVDEEHSRFGFITADALPAGMSIASSGWHATTAYLTEDAALTDDPLHSQSALITLPEGHSLTVWTTMGDWAYVENISGDWIYGFVPNELLSYSAVYHLADHSEGLAMGGLIVDPNGDLTLAMFLPAETAPAAILLKDELQGIEIGIAERIGDNSYQLYGTLPDGTSSISFIPVDENGSRGETLFRVEW